MGFLSRLFNRKPPTLEVTLIRKEFGDDYTGGTVLVEGMVFADSMEPKDRGLSSDMSLDEIKKIKVYGATAIPYGRYRMTYEYSPRLHDRSYAKPYAGKFPCLNDVPGFSGILIHPFNRGTESKGCISFGERWQPGIILNAQKAYKDFMDFYFLPAIKRGQEVWITIKK